jgi:hypothetical protein
MNFLLMARRVGGGCIPGWAGGGCGGGCAGAALSETTRHWQVNDCGRRCIQSLV